ncbi:hypothetical protein [Nostoc sp.]
MNSVRVADSVLSRSQSETGNAILKAPPPLLPTEPPGAESLKIAVSLGTSKK